MFKLDSETELLEAFRPKDRGLVELGPGMKFPMIVRGYQSWVHPAGGRVFLVFAAAGDAPTGIVFATNGAGPPQPSMCDWCHSATAKGPTAVLSARVNAKKVAGVHVCADLSCRQKIEEEANRSGKSAKPAMDKLIQRMGKFASEVLKIDLSGAGR
jgi:hypothetical protein